jgi:hypothetical protein
MTYIQNSHRFRGFKLTFTDWLKFSLIEELTYEIDVWFHDQFLTNDALIGFEAPPSRTFGWVIVSRQLHFHIYNLFVASVDEKERCYSYVAPNIDVRSKASCAIHLHFDISTKALRNNNGIKFKVYILMCCWLYICYNSPTWLGRMGIPIINLYPGNAATRYQGKLLDTEFLFFCYLYILFTLIPLTLYPRRGISDFPPRRPSFTKIT